MYPETKCDHCGQKARNQPAGNGCHTCNRGVMKPFYKLYQPIIEIEYNGSRAWNAFRLIIRDYLEDVVNTVAQGTLEEMERLRDKLTKGMV